MKNECLLFILFFIIRINLAFGGNDDSISLRVAKFETYYQENYQELVYIHTDKAYYLTGERIKFKVYCLEGLTHTPSRLSKIAYVEVLDDENDAILQAKIDLKEGSGYGELFIPTNVNSGNFILRGYTRWMRNYGPETFFHSTLTIINPFKKLGLPPIAENKDITIKFYPESDHIINGLKTKVVFACTDGNGYPAAITGRLYANDTVMLTEFRPSINGMGNFTFTPDINNRYHVELLHEDSTTSSHIFPSIKEKGLVIQVHEKEHAYVVNYFCNDPALIIGQEVLFTILNQGGNILQTDDFVLENNRKSMEIDRSLLDQGTFRLSLFNSKGELLGERILFKYDHIDHNNAIIVDKDASGPREKISIDLSGFITDLPTDLPDISVSISAQQSEFDHQTLNFNDYLLLNNELAGIVYGIENYFKGAPTEISNAITDLLIAKGIKKNLWQRMDQLTEIKYIPEYRTPLVTGNISNKTTNSPAVGILTFLSVPGRNGKLYTTKSRHDGSLIFEAKDFYYGNEIIVQNDYTKDTIYSIEIDNPFSEEYLDIDLPALNIDEEMENWIKQQSQNMQVQNAYLQFQPKFPSLTQIDSSSFYNQPDGRYFLDDYTRFIVMEEVMREYIAGVNVRKNRDGFHFMVIDIERNIVYEKNPLMILDGVPVFDADELMALDPLKVEKIETVKRRFHKGSLDCQGIVNYTTYKGDLAGYELNKHAMAVAYSGIQSGKQYYFPTYASSFDKRSKIPDYRNTLYWEPFIGLIEKNKEIDIYTSDYVSAYEIRIEGIDKNGKIYSYNGYIQVKGIPNN